MGFPYVPPLPPAGPAPPIVDKAPNPWNLMQDYSKTVVTLASSILAVTVTFANSLVGTAPTVLTLSLLGISWLFLVLTIAAALYGAGKLTGYLRGRRNSPAPAPFMFNFSYFTLFLAMLLFGASGLFRFLSDKKPAVPQPAYLERLGQIGPFPVAWRTLCGEKTTEAACRIQTALDFERLGISRLPREPDLIVLVGSADRRQLRGQLAKAYDSNAGLARARAEWVEHELLAHHPALAKKALFLSVYKGPRFTAADASSTDFDADRNVEVWAIGQTGPASTQK